MVSSIGSRDLTKFAIAKIRKIARSWLDGERARVAAFNLEAVYSTSSDAQSAGMSFLTEVPLEEQFGPLEVFQTGLGFVPNLIRAQSLLPRLIEAQAIKEHAILLQNAALSRIQKEQILLCVAADREDAYCASLDSYVLRSLGVSSTQINDLLNRHLSASVSATDAELLDFCLKLSSNPI